MRWGKFPWMFILIRLFLIIPGIFQGKNLKTLCLHNLWNCPICFPGLLNGKIKITGLKIISINNEAKELNEYRIKKYKLHNFFDAFVSSCEVGMRKPDPGIFRLALGIAQAQPQECLYFDDRTMLVEAAKKAGIHAYHHKSFESTKKIIEDAIN